MTPAILESLARQRRDELATRAGRHRLPRLGDDAPASRTTGRRPRPPRSSTA